MDIKWLVLDVDGVLTNGHLIYTSHGEEIKEFHVKDGLGLTAARSCGIKLAIITARVSPMVEQRATELHFDALQMGQGNKTNALRTLCEQEQIDLSQVAYMGDDLNDLGSLQLAGLAIAPANAAAEVKSVADYVTTAEGGAGAVREAVEYILKEQNMWSQVVETYKQEAHMQGQ